jgi:glycosyltransferase involved in cell wall biosynthesis
MTDISIIIPTLNRAGALFEALESIGAMVKPSDPVEIIVVDNGSIDHTGSICREIAAKYPKLRWRYVFDDMPGLLTGRAGGGGRDPCLSR